MTVLAFLALYVATMGSPFVVLAFSIRRKVYRERHTLYLRPRVARCPICKASLAPGEPHSHGGSINFGPLLGRR